MKTTGPSIIFLVTLFSLLIPTHSAPDPTLDTHWQLWVKTHQKNYKDAEEERARRTIWEETMTFITVHNLEYSLGLHTYEVGMNHLGDMRKCGSCYAFSAVGALECQWKKKKGTLVTFSPQELVDCSYSEGNKGCKGGSIRSSFTYMKKSGVMEDFNYPYTGKEEKCKKKKPSKTGVIKDFHSVPARDEILLMKVVGTVGPVSVAINCSSKGFRMYKSGVFYDPSCTSTTNHNVLAIGYGRENGMDYWLVKNSWGVTFGDQGYIKMARNRNNHCGIALKAAYPIV
ncbi:cathepsin S isoform X2 [Xenopus laevis]|uniref:Cathepsin S isoform X2 n=1 Tax=Xenopus laevis TaxID=8355 RepID=A0A8J0TQF2_XENLA|nr:cathepsin S isoform X2 [Xenopus laevis]